MKPITQRIQGELIPLELKNILRLQNPKPEKEAPNQLYLRYALVIRGPESHIFPAFLLDDWGNEIKGLKLYRWFKENGERFPRAEIFGYDADGKESQYFVRDLELYVKLPCYLYLQMSDPVQSGKLLSTIVVPSPTIIRPTAVKRPSATDIPSPLRQSQVRWWLIPIDHGSLDFL